jgi:hypothetical protein
VNICFENISFHLIIFYEGNDAAALQLMLPAAGNVNHDDDLPADH